MISNSAERRQRIKEQSKEVANYMNCIEPSPELVRKWQIKIEYCSKRADREAAVVKIFQLGADMELEACCKWFQEFYKTESWVKHDLKHFRDARRPKPPSLKEQALQALAHLENGAHCSMDTTESAHYIRRALESLPD
jgi:hypothetical protein